jgi:gas vesicle protein
VLLSYNRNTYRDSIENLNDEVIEGLELDTNNLINTVKNINNTLHDYINNNKNKDEKIPKISGTIIEVEEKLTASISEIFPLENKEQAFFLVIMGKKLENLHQKHGLNIHGNSKGKLTLIQIGTELFLPFSASENGLPQGWDKVNDISGYKRNKSENSSTNLSATIRSRMIQIREENEELLEEKKQLIENAAQSIIEMSETICRPLQVKACCRKGEIYPII